MSFLKLINVNPAEGPKKSVYNPSPLCGGYVWKKKNIKVKQKKQPV